MSLRRTLGNPSSRRRLGQRSLRAWRTARSATSIRSERSSTDLRQPPGDPRLTVKPDVTVAGQPTTGSETVRGRGRDLKSGRIVGAGATVMVHMKEARAEAGTGRTGGADAAIGTGSIRTIVDITKRVRASSPGTDAAGRMTTVSSTAVAATRKGMPIRTRIENDLLFGMVAHPRALLLRLLRSLSIAPAAIRAV